MTEAIGPSAAEAARALAAASQPGQRSTGAGAATQSTGTGRSGHEGDSVTLSDDAQEIVKLQLPDGTVVEGRRLTGLKLITPQGQRAESEAAIRQMMTGLGIEGDLEFSIALRDDGSIAATGGGAHAAEIQAAIDADPAFEKTLRDMLMSSKFTYMADASRIESEAAGGGGNTSFPHRWSDSWAAARARTEAASFTFTMAGGMLTTAFAESSGERFGGVAPEAATA